MRSYARAVAGRPGVSYVIYSPLGIWKSWTGGLGRGQRLHALVALLHVHMSATG